MQFAKSPYRWLILGILALANLIACVHRTFPAVLAADLIADFNATASLVGLMSSAFFIPTIFMQVPGGILTDRWGPRRLVTLNLLVATIGSLLFAMSDTVNAAFWARVLVGLGLSMLLVPSYKALSNWFPAKDYVMCVSVLIALSGLGGVVAGSPLAWLSELIGWRHSILVICGLSLICTALLWVVVRNHPRDKGLPAVETQPIDQPEQTDTIPVGQALKTILGSRDFWLLAVWFFVNGAVLLSFSGLWSGPYFMQVYGMTKTQAGYAVNFFSLGWIIGPLLFIWVAARISSRPLVLGGSMGLYTLLLIWMLLRNGVMFTGEIWIWCVFFGLLPTGPASVCFAAAKERFDPRISGTVTGLAYVFPMLGSVVFQPLAGFILERGGHVAGNFTAQDYAGLFWLYVISATVATLSGFMFRARR